MGLKIHGNTKNKILKGLKPAENKEAEARLQKAQNRVRNKPLPCAISAEEIPAERIEANPQNRAHGYETIVVQSSKGKEYKLVVPQSYARHVPKYWSWNDQRYRVADMIAEGIGIREVARTEGMPSQITIYGWLQHPEFKEHVDGLVLETGWANKRERIAGMSRATKKLFDKIIDELDGINLTDKSIGAVLSALPIFAKHLAQEKEEFVEQSAVQQQTNVSGTIITATAKVDEIMANLPSEDQEKMKAELSKMGDGLVAYLTGATTSEGAGK